MRLSECPCPSCQIIRLVQEEQREKFGSDEKGRARILPKEVARIIAKVWAYYLRNTWEVSPADAARMMDIFTDRMSEHIIEVFADEQADEEARH
jgi:hypothetical protein